ncbi:hypothetical protein NECAME_06731 [Necator americanus]|uniref:Uncharacterized protein n=1 Tax=Necator americanus TaxID=51031 RepID=W2TUD5_NECAM|nr:hypothetical protein NECAME_06731 [Necator americanus]ETN84701.1 hypothetical protein NECAME_06731 [Necator americanus]
MWDSLALLAVKGKHAHTDIRKPFVTLAREKEKSWEDKACRVKALKKMSPKKRARALEMQIAREKDLGYKY